MALFHYLHLRAFAHETEDPEKVKQALRTVAQSPDLAVEETRVDGSHGNRILILEAQVKAGQTERRVFAALARDDPGSLDRLRREAPRRLDEHLNFHVRLDKQEAYAGTLRLTTSDDAVTVRGKLRSFPKKGVDPAAEASQALDAFLGGLAGGPPEAG